MAEINLAKALKVKNRLAGRLAKVQVDIQTFNSNHSPGVQGAVQWFTDPAFTQQLTSKLRKPDGSLPRYFQLVLKIKYRDAVPTEISYVTHRELQPEIVGKRGK